MFDESFVNCMGELSATGSGRAERLSKAYGGMTKREGARPSGLLGRILASSERPADDYDGNDGQGQRDDAASCKDL
jgi:hypothetical protein